MPSASEIYKQRNYQGEKGSIVKPSAPSPVSSFHSPTEKEIAQEKRAAAKVFGVEEELKGFKGVLPGCRVKEVDPGTYKMTFDTGNITVYPPRNGKIDLGCGQATTREEFQRLLAKQVEIEEKPESSPLGY